MSFSLRDGDYLVLSDLHIGHQASAVREVAALRPLFAAGRTVIFNGDTFEMRRAVDRENAVHFVAELQALLLEMGTRGIFINGNHDPTLGEIDHLECRDGSVLITHGDVLFHNVAPWSLNEKFYRHAHFQELERLAEHEKTDLVARLAALRRATRSYDIAHVTARPGLAGAILHFVETTWPPWRPLRILRSWAEVPSRAAEFAKTYRPQVKNLLIGHSHFAGIWQRGNLRIINTGSAMSGFRPRCVRFESNRMAVQRLVWSKKKLHFGPEIASFAQ